MASIEKQTISLTKAATLMFFVGNLLVTALGAYWGNKLALERMDSRFRIMELEYRQADELIKRDVSEIQKKVDLAVNSYIGKAIMPREPNYEQEEKKRN